MLGRATPAFLIAVAALLLASVLGLYLQQTPSMARQDWRSAGYGIDDRTATCALPVDIGRTRPPVEWESFDERSLLGKRDEQR
jgi:hypothetical protein